MTELPAPAVAHAAAPKRGHRIARTFRRLMANPGALIGALILLIMVVTALTAPWIVPYDWNAQGVGPRLAAPTAQHLFGTDIYGRDVFSRVVYGSRLSLSVGIATVAFAVVAGSLFGVSIAFIGGRLDEWGSMLIDVMLGFPPIILAILIVSVLGVGLQNVVLAVGISMVPRFARVVRGATLAIKNRPYVEATRALGVRSLRVILRHLLPNVMPTIIVLATLNLAAAIISTASLSFLGLGAQPPTPEWGSMLNASRQYMRYAWWTMVFPGVALFLAVMSTNLLGDRLSEILDPRAARGR